MLEALLKVHAIVKVVTSPDAPVGRKQIITPSPIATYAERQGLRINKPTKVRNNPDFLEMLRELNADIFVVVSYGKILPAELLDIPPLKTINVHFSLLPKYRGASPIQFALLNGEKITGTSIFVLDAEVDHGAIIAQSPIDIEAKDNFSSLAAKLSKMSAELLIKILPEYESGKLQPQLQDHDQATFTTLITKQHGRINWQQTADQIYNQFRAFNVWPGIWTMWNNRVVKILESHPVESDEGNNLLIPCGDYTMLAITKLQLEGKKPMSARDFLNGYKDFTTDQWQ